METPSERLQKIYARFNTNANDIDSRYKEIQPKATFSKQTLYRIEDGSTRSISLRIAQILTEVFPSLNIAWLTTGVGDMLLSVAPQKPPQVHEPQAPLHKFQPKTTNKVISDEEVITIKTYIIPMKGFAGLKNAIYDDQYITETFEESTTEVPKHLYSPVSYRIQSTGDSMPMSIPEGAWVTGVPVPQMIWNTYKFVEGRIYILFHPYRGILFKHVRNLEEGVIELFSQNGDKLDHPDEEFKITEFRKILLAIKVENFI